MTQIHQDQLKHDIKQLIIDSLKIEEITPDDVPDDAPLFGKNNVMGLDSIDGIVIIMAIQKKYNVRMDDQNVARFILESINTIADFVTREQAKQHA
jgi:acyl carrier protein